MQLKVKTSTQYTITITHGLDKFAESLPRLKGDKVCVLNDETVNKLYPNTLDLFFGDKKVFTYTVPQGEISKSIEIYAKVLEFLAENSFDRSDTLVAFGGGVVGDLGGFVASTYMRGISFIQVPTTLLADVDSSVGGKTAINLSFGKNLCGTFYQPKAVYVNVDFFNTLPKREIDCGKGEIAKYCFLTKEKDLNINDYEKLIYSCLNIKREIVEQDERESGLRKLLNLGHTFGHAIEKYENYKLSHGECVGLGLRYALKVSASYYKLDEKTLLKANGILDKFGCSKKEYPTAELLELIRLDKKSNSNGVDFVMIDNDLDAKIVFLTYEELAKHAL